MRRIVLVLSIAALMVAMMMVSALPAFADHVGPHQHFIDTPEESEVENVGVGPQVCTLPQTNEGFQRFHHNVHTGTPNSEDAFDRPENPVNLTSQLC